MTAKFYRYLREDSSRNKEAKGTKNYVIKRQHKFEDNKNCSEAVQLKNKINHLKNEIEVYSLRKNRKQIKKAIN